MKFQESIIRLLLLSSGVTYAFYEVELSKEERWNITYKELREGKLIEIVRFINFVCQYGDKIRTCQVEFDRVRRNKINDALLMKCKYTYSGSYEIDSYLFGRIDCDNLKKCIEDQKSLCEPHDPRALYYILLVFPILSISIILIIVFFRKRKSKRNLSYQIAMQEIY